jgi:hypothetical protein
MRNNPSWPKIFAFIGIAVMGLALALYSTDIANGGIFVRLKGTDRSGDLLSLGVATMMVGIAIAAAFAYLALTQIRALTRRS